MVGVDRSSILNRTRIGVVPEEVWVEGEEDGHGAMRRPSKVARRNGRNRFCTTRGRNFLTEIMTASENDGDLVLEGRRRELWIRSRSVKQSGFLEAD